MFKVEIFPEYVLINNAVITNDVIQAVLSLQSPYFIGTENPDYDNSGVTSIVEYITELNNYFIELIATKGKDENCDTETNMLSHLYWINDQIKWFKVPAEIMAQLNKTN